MKKLFYILLGATSLLTTVSCTKDFDELNINPNLIDKVTPGSLVTPTVYGMSNYFTLRSYDFTWQIMQVGLPNPSVQLGIHRYDFMPTSGNGTWNTCYTWLRSVREMREAADAFNQPVYHAVASTLQAYIGGILTDSFGDVPFSEALLAEDGINQPKFDTQEEIYTRLINDLEEANKIYAGEGNMSGNDLLYNNDKTKWRKFNNSLLLRLLLRTSNQSTFDSYNRIRQILGNETEYPIFTSNADAALVTITGIAPYSYAWARRQDYVNFEAMSSFFVDMLNDMNDPRRPLFMTQASRMVDGAPQAIGYKGIPSAHSGDESQFDYSPSTPNGNLMIYDQIGTPIKQVMMSYAEVEFIKAETALHIGNQDLAKECYERGVTAAIIQWNGGAIPVDYFDNEAAAFDGTLERVLDQKYLALFFNDYQQWYEYRRTGYPVLPKTEHMLHDGIMPSRFMYHSDVQRYNPENYKAAVDRIGKDDFHTKVWWEK